MFQGVIPIGTTTTAELHLDRNARGSAALLIAWSDGNGTGQQDHVIVHPGTTDSVTVTPNRPAFLRVFVDMNDNRDLGELVVTPHPSDSIRGDTSWTYSVE